MVVAVISQAQTRFQGNQVVLQVNNLHARFGQPPTHHTLPKRAHLLVNNIMVFSARLVRLRTPTCQHHRA